MPEVQTTKQQPESEFPFAVTVGQVYDGPLDLLLDLVRKQNIDIHDIPIAKITAQFLAYTERMKQFDVDSAAAGGGRGGRIALRGHLLERPVVAGGDERVVHRRVEAAAAPRAGGER